MVASDDPQRFLLHRLRIHADSRDGMPAERPELFLRDAVRPSRLDREFLNRAHIKILLNRAAEAVQLLRLQRGRRPSADVDRVQNPPLHDRRGLFQLSLKRTQILADPLLPQRDVERRKGTVQTGGRTERNPDIEAVAVFIMDAGEDSLLAFCDVHGKSCLLFRDLMLLLKEGDGFLFPGALFHLCHGNLRRPDADEVAPGELLPRIVRKRLIQKRLQRILGFLALGRKIRAGRCRKFPCKAGFLSPFFGTVLISRLSGIRLGSRFFGTRLFFRQNLQ